MLRFPHASLSLAPPRYLLLTRFSTNAYIYVSAYSVLNTITQETLTLHLLHKYVGSFTASSPWEAWRSTSGGHRRGSRSPCSSGTGGGPFGVAVCKTDGAVAIVTGWSAGLSVGRGVVVNGLGPIG